MTIHFVGTGTSQGVPVIGCQCDVCLSEDPRDKRLRSGVFLRIRDVNMAIDVGPDFRQQMLAVGATRLDAVLITHEHNDHVAGIDDIRPFNFMQRAPLKVYTLPRVAADLTRRFAYIFSEQKYPGAPSIDLVEIEPYVPFTVAGCEVLPLVVGHGGMSVLAFRIGDFTYITDANEIPSETLALIAGCPMVTLNALHHRAHHAHFNLSEAIETASKIGAQMTYLLHVSHQMGLHREISRTLPENVTLAYDGLILETA